MLKPMLTAPKPDWTNGQIRAWAQGAEHKDRDYREMSSSGIEKYLNHSYWNEGFPRKPTDGCSDNGFGVGCLFWEIRGRLGKDFTDRLAVFALRAMLDKPYTDTTQSFEQYFYERLKMADSVIDNEDSKMPDIDAIAKERGWLLSKQP
jgi:hypothetical protein